MFLFPAPVEKARRLVGVNHSGFLFP